MSKHFAFRPVKRRERWMHAQGKRHDLWMPRLAACLASTAHTLTLHVRCVLHSSYIPSLPVLTCAKQEN